MPWSDVAQLPMTTFLAYVGIQWWAFRNTDGGGMFIQRFISSKTEEDAQKAAWLFNVLHYVVRTWPWIVVALVALTLYPALADPEIGYIRLMLDYLPAGLLGLVVASFLTAFMSTVSTLINWGTSYIVNDLYVRWANPDAGDKEKVLVGRVASVVIVALAATAAFFVQDIGTVFRFMIAIGTGPGAVLILRWFWWRVNAWGELAAPAGDDRASAAPGLGRRRAIWAAWDRAAVRLAVRDRLAGAGFLGTWYRRARRGLADVRAAATVAASFDSICIDRGSVTG